MQQYAMTYGIVIGQIINENNVLTPGKNKKDRKEVAEKANRLVAVHAPFTKHPYDFPKTAFDTASMLTTTLNILIDQIAKVTKL